MAQSYAVNTVNSKSNIRAALTQEKAKEKKFQRRIKKVEREREREKKRRFSQKHKSCLGKRIRSGSSNGVRLSRPGRAGSQDLCFWCLSFSDPDSW